MNDKQYWTVATAVIVLSGLGFCWWAVEGAKTQRALRARYEGSIPTYLTPPGFGVGEEALAPDPADVVE